MEFRKSITPGTPSYEKVYHNVGFEEILQEKGHWMIVKEFLDLEDSGSLYSGLGNTRPISSGELFEF
ncbi:hypothetical protein H1R20_g2391, partial [Candolleomyces eurysporus]